MKKRTLFTILVIIALCLSSVNYALAGVDASDLIANYGAAMVDNGSGSISVYFDVTGTKAMDKIGSSMIYLYEYDGSSWTHVKTFLSSNSLYSSKMIGEDTGRKSGLLDYSGTSGYKYYAQVYIYAELAGKTDSRIMTASAITAS